jgi:hypothetical protein
MKTKFFFLGQIWQRNLILSDIYQMKSLTLHDVFCRTYSSTFFYFCMARFCVNKGVSSMHSEILHLSIDFLKQSCVDLFKKLSEKTRAFFYMNFLVAYIRRLNAALGISV